MSDEDEAIVLLCEICGLATDLCCVDCGIDSGGERIPHVCSNPACRDQHELRTHGAINQGVRILGHPRKPD